MPSDSQRRILLLRGLRLLNFIALILAVWPLILAAEWLDLGELSNGIWPSFFKLCGLAIIALLSMLPLYIQQKNYIKELNQEDVLETSNLAEIEDALYPIEEATKPETLMSSPGRHAARALGEMEQYKAWRKAYIQYWTSRLMGTVGINVIRSLLMLVFGIVFALIGRTVGQISMVALGVSALLLSLYCFDIPHKAYGDIFKSAHLTAHIVMVIILQMVRSFFRYPLQPDFHLFILFYLTFIYFLTRNQTNIDHLMRQGSRSLKELPHGLRSFNAKLTTLLTISFPVIYVLRRPIARTLVFIWDTFVMLVSAFINFMMNLLPDPEPIPQEPIPSEAAPENGLGGGEGNYWVQAVITALVITLIVFLLRRYGKQMALAIRDMFRKLIAFIKSLFQQEHEESEDVEEGRYYTDYHFALDPSRPEMLSLRGRRRAWRKDYREYKRQVKHLGPTVNRYREAYRLALVWLDIKEDSGLDISDTVHEIANKNEAQLEMAAIADKDGFVAVTKTYEDARYGLQEGLEESLDTARITEHLAELERQLERMDNQL